jgi:ribosomal protein S18 acetylase RimI-like enzyme
MTGQVIIRDVRPGDVETLVDIAVAAWEPVNEARRQIMGEELYVALNADWRERKARQVRSDCASDGRSMVCVAERGGRVVGFAAYSANAATGVGQLGNNAVRPDARGKGVAGKMYQYVFDRLRERGMRFVHVGTGGDPGHAPARRAYEKAGFDIRDPKVHYYRKL